MAGLEVRDGAARLKGAAPWLGKTDDTPTHSQRAEAGPPPLLGPRHAREPDTVGPVRLEGMQDEEVRAACQDALLHPMLLHHQHIPHHTRHHAAATTTTRTECTERQDLLARRALGTTTHVWLSSAIMMPPWSHKPLIKGPESTDAPDALPSPLEGCRASPIVTVQASRVGGAREVSRCSSAMAPPSPVSKTS